MSTRVNDPRTSAKVVVMQRCHQQDLSGHLLAQGGWEHLCLPAEYEDPRAPLRSASSTRAEKPGELLWPERFGRDRNRRAENQSRQLWRGRPAAAASVARGWRNFQAALVPIFSPEARTSARHCSAAGWHADSIEAIEVPARSMTKSSPGIARSRIFDLRLCGRAGVGPRRVRSICWATKFVGAWTARPRCKRFAT